jgi:hypothetical protein
MRHARSTVTAIVFVVLGTTYCGRVVSDESASDTGAHPDSTTVVADAERDATLYDSGVDTGVLHDIGGCMPKSCGDLGTNCGPVGDGCGGLVDCGTCTPPDICGGSGKASVCGSAPCIKKTCGELGATCGKQGDGCGGLIDCGACTPPTTCGGGGVPNACGSTTPPADCGTAPGSLWAMCDGRCVDLYSDNDNCGHCGFACLPKTATSKCAPRTNDGGVIEGTCVCGGGSLCTPRPGWGSVPCPVDGGVLCVELGFDPDNCGGCGVKCPASAQCCADGGCADLHDTSFGSGCGAAELCP